MLENEIDQIEVINTLSRPDSGSSKHDYYDTVETGLGNYWFSYRQIPQDITYQAQLPCGIHIGAGNASLEMMGDKIAPFLSDGPLASYFIQHPNNVIETESTLKQGNAISCGLFISWEGYQLFPDDIASFIDKISTGPAFNGANHISALTVERLCSPLDPRYHGDTAKLIGEARAYELLAAVMAAFSFNSMLMSKVEGKHRKYAYSTRDFIDANLMRPLTLQLLAKEIGINVRSLTQLFKREFDLSINQYLVEQRMLKALTLLESGLSVSETAYRVGYSLPYFSEKFQQRFGFVASHVMPQRIILKT